MLESIQNTVPKAATRSSSFNGAGRAASDGAWSRYSLGISAIELADSSLSRASPLFVQVSISPSSASESSTPQGGFLFALLMTVAGLAIGGPALLARNLPPSATFFNQAVALAGWSALLALAMLCLKAVPAMPWRRLFTGLTVLGLLAVAAVGSSLLERLPAPLSVSALGLLVSAALTLWVGGVTGRDEAGRMAFQVVCAALLLAGLISVALANVQVFAPDLADGDWIARSSTPGRTGGNLRQPNHLSSLLLWAMAPLVWLHETLAERPTTPAPKPFRVITALLMALLLFGDVLTVSRTGTVCVVLLALWGVVDKRLSRFSRVLLWLAPLFYALCWMGMSEWTQAGSQAFAGGVQLHKSDPSSSVSYTHLTLPTKRIV